MKRVVLIKTCARYRERRMAVEATWAGALRRLGVPCRFVEGGHKEFSYDTSCIYTTCDERVQQGLTYNAVKLQVGLLHYARLCEFDYIFVADDDTFVHPDRWLLHEPAGDLECRMFKPTRPRDVQRRGEKPWVHGGPGWYMSRRLVHAFIDATVTRNMNDDVVVARFVQSHAREYSVTDRPDLYGSDRYAGREDEVTPDNGLITCHHVAPSRMRELYRMISP